MDIDRDNYRQIGFLRSMGMDDNDIMDVAYDGVLGNYSIAEVMGICAEHNVSAAMINEWAYDCVYM